MRPYSPDDDFIGFLHAAVDGASSGDRVGPRTGWPPSHADIADAFNTACRLAAQLHEGERLFTRLLLFAVPGNYPGFFYTPGASASSLRGLAVAFPEGVAVHPGDGGLVPFGGLTGHEELSRTAPCVVFSASPGYVSVMTAGRLLAVAPLGEDPTLVGAQPWSSLRKLLLAAGLNEDAPLKVEDLAIIAAGARRHGHGGTFIIGPADATLDGDSTVEAMVGRPEQAWFESAEASRMLADPDGNARATAAVLRAGFHPEWRELRAATEQEAWERAKVVRTTYHQLLARMTRADGAVFLRQDWAVLGFGMRLKTSASVEHVIRRDVGRTNEREVATAELGGTRIQSAANWIASKPGGEDEPRWFALVASSDGPVRLVCKDGDRVVVTYGVEAFL